MTWKYFFRLSLKLTDKFYSCKDILVYLVRKFPLLKNKKRSLNSLIRLTWKNNFIESIVDPDCDEMFLSSSSLFNICELHFLLAKLDESLHLLYNDDYRV